ncbi:MAG: hypothetical protein M3Z25_05485 [Actinomycetota bacterium]|nr:hypothetical protein [Actinomycetota bacterium]
MDLTNIATMGSAGFLIIFAAVNLAEARTAAERGSAPWISTLAAITCVAALLALITDSTPAAVLVLLVMVAAAFGIEFVSKGSRPGAGAAPSPTPDPLFRSYLDESLGRVGPSWA